MTAAAWPLPARVTPQARGLETVQATGANHPYEKGRS
jgi:hypothetical protein